MAQLDKEGAPGKSGAIRKLPVRLLLWPAIALLLTGVVWWFALARADTVRAAAASAMFKEAQATADAYEQYVTRSVAQMDQVSMQLKHSWEQASTKAPAQPATQAPAQPSAQSSSQLLEKMARDGMFLDDTFFSVSIINRTGMAVSATRAADQGKRFGAAAFFQFHKNNNTSALLVGPPPGPPIPVHEQVMFSRRLDTPGDEFAGVLVIIVPARYFTSFYMASTSGKQGLVATMGAETGLRAESAPRAGHMGGAGLSAFPDDAGIWAQRSGATLVAGRFGFRDGHARVLAWRRSPVYPVVALVALSHAEGLAAAHMAWIDSRNHAILASVCLLLLCMAALALSRRAALRVSAREDVQLAYRTATESANDGFYMAAAVRDAQGQIVDFEIVDCNERGAAFYGMARAALIGERLSALDAAVPGSSPFDTYQHAMASGFHEDEREMPADSRLTIRWGQRRLVRVANGLAITLRDISERKAHAVALQRLANEDLLTGLPNRHWLMHFLPRLLVQAAGQQVVVMLIDLDDFKSVNEVHGHAAGDLVLTTAAQRIRGALRPLDHVVRFGGDEFIVLLAGSDGADGAARTALVAGRIVATLAEKFVLGEERVAVGASIGISSFPNDAGDAATLIKLSDIAMHAGKTGGKGRYHFFEPALAQALHKRSQLKRNLLEAIEKDQFVLYFQPRVDARSGQLCSMEALIRWIHPEQGMIGPGEFITFAEENGLIVSLGELVMREACAQLAAWRRAGLDPVPMSINVSPKQFAGAGVSAALAACLERYAIAPSLIEVEITESAMLGDQAEVLAELSRLRALGIKLHIDDFGTGYSSLSQLQKLKMDVLKVDRSFTVALGQSGEGEVFFQAIVSMAHALGMTVVAEGVETAGQLQILQRLGCDEVQGYLIARPMPASAFAALLGARQMCVV